MADELKLLDEAKLVKETKFLRDGYVLREGIWVKAEVPKTFGEVEKPIIEGGNPELAARLADDVIGSAHDLKEVSGPVDDAAFAAEAERLSGAETNTPSKPKVNTTKSNVIDPVAEAKIALEREAHIKEQSRLDKSHAAQEQRLQQLHDQELATKSQQFGDAQTQSKQPQPKLDNDPILAEAKKQTDFQRRQAEALEKKNKGFIRRNPKTAAVVGGSVAVGGAYEANDYLDPKGGWSELKHPVDLIQKALGGGDKPHLKYNSDKTQAQIVVNTPEGEHVIKDMKPVAEQKKALQKIDEDNQGLAGEFKKHPFIMATAGVIICVGGGAIVGDVVSVLPGGKTAGKLLSKLAEKNLIKVPVGLALIGASAYLGWDEIRNTVSGSNKTRHSNALAANIDMIDQIDLDHASPNAERATLTLNMDSASLDGNKTKVATVQSIAMSAINTLVSPTNLSVDPKKANSKSVA